MGEKTNRDHTIRFLNDEISSQDEVINKINKEKKHVNEGASKASEDLQVVEEKANHLNNVKSQLEATLDELEDSVNREKKARADIDKERRRSSRNWPAEWKMNRESFQKHKKELRSCKVE